jgi:hypothetical protein
MNARTVDPADAPHRSPLLRRVWFFLRVSLVLVGLTGVKILVHRKHWELLTPNPLFPALVASEVFLLGFLLHGVLLDYKEAEKIPGELAPLSNASPGRPEAPGRFSRTAGVNEALVLLAGFSEDLLAWMKEAGPTTALLNQLDDVQRSIEQFAQKNPAPLQARLLLELSQIRRLVYRIGVIRATTFVPTLYGVAYIGTALLSGGLLLTDIEPFGESLFFISAISLLLIKMLWLIADLDNPFSANLATSVEHVSLSPVALAVERLQRLQAEG